MTEGLNQMVRLGKLAIADFAAQHLRVPKERPKQKPNFAELVYQSPKAWD
jgi:hypothetical protein